MATPALIRERVLAKNPCLPAWEELAAGIKVGGLMPITFSLYLNADRYHDVHNTEVMVRGVLQTVAVVSTLPFPEQITVQQDQHCPAWLPASPAWFVQFANELYRHEVAEWISYKGLHFADPHTSEQTRHYHQSEVLRSLGIPERRAALARRVDDEP